MARKFVLSTLMAISLFFAGYAVSNAMEKPADGGAGKDKAQAASSVKKPLDPKEEAKDKYNSGLMAMSHGNWKMAEGFLLDAIKLDPGHANTHTYLARVYENMNQKTLAIEHYKTAIKLKPDNPGPYEGLMGVYFSMGLTKEVISTASEASKYGIPKETFAGDLGWAYYLNGDFGNAETYFKKDKEKKVLDSTPCNNLGLLYFRQGRYDDALAQFNEASELNKHSVVLPYFLAITYTRLGKEDEVLKALKEGVKRDPDLDKKIPSYNSRYLPGIDPGDLSAMFKKLKEEKD